MLHSWGWLPGRPASTVKIESSVSPGDGKGLKVKSGLLLFLIMPLQGRPIEPGKTGFKDLRVGGHKKLGGWSAWRGSGALPPPKTLLLHIWWLQQAFPHKLVAHSDIFA